MGGQGTSWRAVPVNGAVPVTEAIPVTEAAAVLAAIRRVSTLVGGAGNDTLVGVQGDVMQGGAGNDQFWLKGGAGDAGSTLQGGNGNDNFHVRRITVMIRSSAAVAMTPPASRIARSLM